MFTNAAQPAQFFQTAFGLSAIEQRTFGNGAEATSFLLAAGDVRIVLTTTPSERGISADLLSLHGDGVRDIALRVGSVKSAFACAVQAGARAIEEPNEIRDGPTVCGAQSSVPRDMVHSLVERDTLTPAFLPGGIPAKLVSDNEASNILAIDHLALSIPQGELSRWTSFYEMAFGFEIAHCDTTSTPYSGMRSMVVQNPAGTVKFPIVEPAKGESALK